MKIDWTEQDLQRFAETYGREMGGGSTQKEALAAVGSEAVTLMAVRGGAMTAEELRLRLAVIAERLGPTSALHLGVHMAAQGARIAEREANTDDDFSIEVHETLAERCPCGVKTQHRCACSTWWCLRCLGDHISAPGGRCPAVVRMEQTNVP